MTKRIFLTGGSGFIGKNLVEFLKGKYTVFSPTHRNLDLLDTGKVEKYIKKNKIDVIIHSAIIGGKKTDILMNAAVHLNLKMFFNIVRNSGLVDKIIYLGSGLEYDKNRNLSSVKETEFDKRIPEDDYGFYKYVSAKYVEASQNIYDLVIFGIYGKYEDYLYRFISNSLVKNLLHQQITINHNAYFSYLYIEDLFPVVEYFINHRPEFRRYNLAPDKKISLLAIANLINQISGYKSKIKIIKKGLNFEYSADNKRVRNEMKNLQFTTYEEGIKKLYNWYKINLKKIDIRKVKQDPHLKFLSKHKSLYEKK